MAWGTASLGFNHVKKSFIDGHGKTRYYSSLVMDKEIILEYKQIIRDINFQIRELEKSLDYVIQKKYYYYI